MLSVWGGGEGVAELSPSPCSWWGSTRHHPAPAQQEGAPLPASGFVEPPGSEQDVSLLEETIRNSS